MSTHPATPDEPASHNDLIIDESTPKADDNKTAETIKAEPVITNAVVETVEAIQAELEQTAVYNNEQNCMINESILPTNASEVEEELANISDDHQLTTNLSDVDQEQNFTTENHEPIDNESDHGLPTSDPPSTVTNIVDNTVINTDNAVDCVEPITDVTKTGQSDTSDANDHQPLVAAADNNSDPTQSSNQKTENSNVPSESTASRPPYIPPHIMGRSLSNPADDLIGSGRRVQKPRLGVKVPYRNLTSQIVTQDEIAQEILERSLRKYTYKDSPDTGDVIFAMKLTHRLANKISCSESIEKKLESIKPVAAAPVTPSKNSDSPTEHISPKSSDSRSPIAKRTEISTAAPVVTSPSEIVAETTSSDTNVNIASPVAVASSSTTPVTNDVSTELLTELAPVPMLESDDIDNKLYAEISSTLKEECDLTAMPVELFTSAQLRAQQKNMKADIPGIVNGAVTMHVEGELDNDTLLAILEGTSDVNEISSKVPVQPAAVSAPISSTPKVDDNHKRRKFLVKPRLNPIVEKELALKQLMNFEATPRVENNEKRRKMRVKPRLDPNVEKELALKQLMDFEPRRKKSKEEREAAATAGKLAAAKLAATRIAAAKNTLAKSKAAKKTVAKSVSTAEQSVQTEQSMQTEQSAENEIDGVKVKPTNKDANMKKVKRSNNTFNVTSQAPKRFLKKYQRSIKRQLRSSKMKMKKSSSELHQQQKKLPQVPEVDIAIDRYIKTYASKRKHKPDNQSPEKPAEKKMKLDKGAQSSTTHTSVTNAACTTAVAKTAATVLTKSASRPEPVTTPESTAAAALTVRSVASSNHVDVVPADDENSEDEEMTQKEAVALADKENAEVLAKSKANSKMMREINRLLGDEGAINMIYSVEQKRLPGSKRDANVAAPGRRKKKDLQLRTKLVKNAVLRLSMSSSSLGTPTRVVRRLSPEATPDVAAGDAVPATAPPSSSKSTAAVAAAAAAAARKASVESVESTLSEPNNNNNHNANNSRSITPKTRKIAAEASRIIRRHSSSSAYSSDDEVEAARKVACGSRLEPLSAAKSPVTEKGPGGEKVGSGDAAGTAVAVEPVSSDSCTNGGVPNEAAGATPVERKDPSQSSASAKTKSPATSRRESKEAAAAVSSLADVRTHVDLSINGRDLTEHKLSLKEITVRKYDNLVQIILISSSTKMKNALNVAILHELISVLSELENDDSCRTVLVTSTGGSFCQGIDLQTLICVDKAERARIVNEFISTLVSFTKCISRFRKILIAGVHGSAVGLGVTMLPFFDMVYASDKATFYTPYVKLGQIPEAGATLTLPHLLGNAVTSELLFGCRMLTASEALQFGLVTRILWPDKFTEELLPLARGIAGQSSKAMEATKLLLRQGMTAKLEEQLETESKLLCEHWCSDECQNRFKKYLDQEALLQNK